MTTIPESRSPEQLKIRCFATFREAKNSTFQKNRVFSGFPHWEIAKNRVPKCAQFGTPNLGSQNRVFSRFHEV